MSAIHERRPLAEVLPIAEELRDLVAAQAEHAEIVGSIRRRKPTVADIEILYRPTLEPVPDLFGDAAGHRNRTFEFLETLRGTVLVDRLSKVDLPAFGPRFQRVIYKGIPADLFACIPPAQWGILRLLRTGPAEFNIKLVSSTDQGGWMLPMMRLVNGTLRYRGKTIDVPDEETFFRLINRPYIPPEDRE